MKPRLREAIEGPVPSKGRGLGTKGLVPSNGRVFSPEWTLIRAK
jgi:hypothetical protein